MFLKGYIQSAEQRARRSVTMKAQYAAGLRTAPVNPWTPNQRTAYSARAAAGLLDRVPIGTVREGNHGGKIYCERKVGIGRNGWVYEHRWIMSQHLGRPLLTMEHVHHMNGDTLDNRLENLVVLLNRAHSSLNKRTPVEATEARRLKPGQWSHAHAACILCHRTDSRHASHGRCNRCDVRLYRATQAARGSSVAVSPSRDSGS